MKQSVGKANPKAILATMEVLVVGESNKAEGWPASLPERNRGKDT